MSEKMSCPVCLSHESSAVDMAFFDKCYLALQAALIIEGDSVGDAYPTTGENAVKLSLSRVIEIGRQWREAGRP